MSTSFSLPPLPYDQSALEPYIDAATMKIHHDNHHGTYVSKLNAALADAPASDIFKILKEASASKPAIRNNGSTPATLTIIGGGHYNHTLFWKWMAPVGTANAAPRGALKEAIDKKWGSTDEMRKKFNEAAAGRFGSGWAWLGVTSNGSLEITSTPNQDNPLMEGLVDAPMIPILGLDVWEHAYYLKYQNRRPEYIEKWWNVVNWDTVVKAYDEYASKGKPVPISI